MLTYTPMKKLAGIRLEGDYLTLRSLNETIHQMTNDDRMPYKHEENLLALAYDVRKAYEQQRDVIKPNIHYPEIGVRYGVAIIWPMLLFQSRQLREALAWGPSMSKHQACAYALEDVIETAIADQFGRTAAEVTSRWHAINPRFEPSIEQINPVGAMFSSWSKAERAKRMGTLLSAFVGIPSDTMHQIMVKNGRDSISPAELDSWRNNEWVDPETGR